MKKRGFEVGDEILVTTPSEKINGIFLPSLSNSVISIKLNTGYNLSIKKTEVKSIKLVRKHKPIVHKVKLPKMKNNLPKISILGVGGTLASRVDYKTGAVSPQFSTIDLIQKIPNVVKIANIKTKLISNVLSENIRFHNYNEIAKEIEKEVKKDVKGVIITYGTDTLHYIAAALSFILENLNIPVILVGSQRSSDRPSTDSVQNLKDAIRFIVETDFYGVGVCMHSSMEDRYSSILPACKVRKLHSSRRDAFKPVNSDIIASIGKVIKFSSEFKKAKIDGKLKVKPIKENFKIGLLKSHPQLSSKEVDFYKNYDALIIEGTGLGHLPIEKIDSKSSENVKVLDTVKKIAKKIPVIMTTQCIFGRVDMNVYSTGRKLLDINVLGNNQDILSEVAYIKAAWLLSNHKKQFRELWDSNLRGEINERILPSQYL